MYSAYSESASQSLQTGRGVEVELLVHVQQISVQDASGFMIGVFLDCVRKTTEREKHVWSRVAAHLAAGLRLRKDIPAIEDLIIEADGSIAHADGDAKDVEVREHLRRAAMLMDRARTRAVRSSDEALELWPALVSGRWSMVDRFDTDGRRYLVAKRNPPDAPSLPLTAREARVIGLAAQGHPNKIIAYELGLPNSVVSEALNDGMTKLGLDSRAALLQLAALAAPKHEE